MITSRYFVAAMLSIVPCLLIAQETVTIYYAAPTSYTGLSTAVSRGLYNNSSAPRNPSRYPSYVTDYYEDWRLPIEKINWTNATHAVLFYDDGNVTQTSPYFAFSTAGTAKEAYERGGGGSTTEYQRRFIDSAHARNIKVLLIIQAVMPGNLNYVTDDSARTQTFSDAVIAYAKQRNFDGISLNWEGWAAPINPDTTEIARLLRMLRQGLDTMNPRGILEMAPGPTDWNHYPRNAVNAYVDMIHLQEYAFTPGYDTRPVPHRATTWWECPIYNGTWDIANFSSLENWGPLQWVARGFSPDVMGAMFPALGRIFKGVDSLYGLYSLAGSGNMTMGIDVTYLDRDRFLANGGRDTSDPRTKGYAVLGTAATTQSGIFAGRNIDAGVKFFATFMDSTNVAEGVKWGRNNGVHHFAMFSLTNDPAQRLHSDFLVQFEGGSSRPSPPFTPGLSSPSDGATGVGLTPTLIWSPWGNPTKYRIQVSTNSTFTNLIQDDSSLTSTSVSLASLSYLTTYYWRVAAGNAYGWSAFTPARSFTTLSNMPPGVPSLTAPQDHAEGESQTPTLTWSAQLAATKYWLQVSSDSLFALLTVNDSTLTSSSVTLPALAHSTTYYWRVAAGNIMGWSAMSSPLSFTTLDRPDVPQCITLNQNYPNPFNPTTTVSFYLTESQHISIKVFDILGKEIATLADEVLPVGPQERVWNAAGMPSGIYYCRLFSGSILETKVMILVK